MRNRIALATALLLGTSTVAMSQSSPNLVYGQVPSAAQWNSYFAAKQDYSPALSAIANGSTPVSIFTSSQSGTVPASGGGATNFLRADGTWAAPAGGGAVDSVFGRTGVVTAQSGDYSVGQVTGAAPLASPTFTGTVTIPNGAVLNTPTSIDLTNAVNLPVATGISGLGANVATWLATPSGANLASALTSALPISKGGTGQTAAGVATLTALGALTGTASGSTYLAGDGSWKTPSGSGNVTAGGTLTSNQIVIGQGTQAVATLGSLGTATTVLHGNASGAPTFGSVNLASDVSGALPTTGLTNSVNLQTGTSYTVLSTDGGKTVAHSNAATITETLPQASGSFAVGYAYRETNVGAGGLNISTTTSTFPNGATSLPTIVTGQAVDLESVNGNWSALVGLPVMAQATILGRASGAGSNYPSALSQTQVTALINLATTSLSGAIPATGTPSGKYLKDNLTWDTPSGGGGGVSYAYVPNAWMFAEAPGVILGSGSAPAANTIIFEPFVVTGTMTPSDFALFVTTTSAGGNAQVAIYANSTSWIGPTGSPLIVSNNISTASANGVAAGGLITSAQLTPGIYWRGTNHDNTTAIFKSYTNNLTAQNIIAGADSVAHLIANSSATGTKITLASTFGTWPTISGNGSFTYAAAASSVPAVVMQIGTVP